uniref:Alkylated DNA repair protein AlkB homologue 8 N-terminal domain-containing protein n=1 Tax=Knipowitschia caucasica TaxID=637954 RepID=A0AAV2J3Y8_KNICA
MIVDFRKSTVPPPPPSVMDSPITSVESFRFLGTTITQYLKWEPTISSLIKKAQQRMYFLRQLRKAKLPAQMLVQFYTAIIESILTSSVTVWFAGATVRDKQRLQRIVRSAEEVIGRSLPSLQDLSRVLTGCKGSKYKNKPCFIYLVLMLFPEGATVRTLLLRMGRRDCASARVQRDDSASINHGHMHNKQLKREIQVSK